MSSQVPEQVAAERAARKRPAIEVEGLTKVYGRGANAVRAVDEIDLGVPRGQVFGLLGPNGSGKTTTIKMLSGLVAPTAGRVRLDGFDVSRQRSAAVRRLGAVLEGSRNVYWSLSAWQNLLYFGRLKGLRKAEIAPRAERLLTELGLWQRRNALVNTFSRGMAQKVAVAAALITDPPILLLDEPTIGLDVEAARTVKDWMRHLARRENKTLVLTTHQLEVAEELCDRVAVIRDGRILADLPTRELLDRFQEDRYEVRVAHMAASLGFGLPEGTQLETDDEGATRITLPTTDREALDRLLARLAWRDESRLISVNPIRPDLEEVFLRLVKEGTPDA